MDRDDLVVYDLVCSGKVGEELIEAKRPRGQASAGARDLMLKRRMWIRTEGISYAARGSAVLYSRYRGVTTG